MDYCILFFSLLMPLVIGWVLLDCLTKSSSYFYIGEKIFIAFGLGFGLMTITMFYFSLFGIDFDISKIIILNFFPFAAFAIYLKHRRHGLVKNDRSITLTHIGNERWSLFEIFLVIFLILNTSLVIVRTLLVEYDIWDGWAVWAFKAKIYFVHHTIPWEKYLEFSKVWGNWDYPHHVPLMEAWILLCLGYWNDQVIRIIFPIFFLGICVCLYYLFRRYTSRQVSLIGSFFISTSTALQTWTIGAITEPIILFYYLMSVVFILRWRVERHQIFIYISAIFAGLADWTKNEGIAYLLFNFILIFFLSPERKNSEKIKTGMHYAVIILIIIGGWLIFRHAMGLENLLINSNRLAVEQVFSNIPRLKEAILLLFIYFFDFNYFNVIWILFFIFVFLNRRKCLKFPQVDLLTLISFHILLILAIRLLDTTSLFLTDAMGRLLIAPSILSIMYVILLTNE